MVVVSEFFRMKSCQFLATMEIFVYLCPRKTKGDTNMATPIKIIPTLRGEAARAFIERAEERERNPHPTPIYTESEKKAYYRMLEESGMPL